MKTNLMFNHMDFNIKAEPCFGKDALTADLELSHIISTMAQGDSTIREACRTALLCPLHTMHEIRYRQDILQDCIQHPGIIRKLYNITIETMKRKRESWSWLSRSSYLPSNFSSAINLLKIYTEMLLELRNTAGENRQRFKSAGITNLINMLYQELDDAYFSEISSHLKELKNDDAIVVSSRLGNYNQGVGYVMRRKQKKRFWRRWYFSPSYTIAPRDDSGASDLGKRRDRAINESINALAQSADHIESFFVMLQDELAFYVGCLNLHDKLRAIDVPVCIPGLLPVASENRLYDALYDVSLALMKNAAVVGNGINAKGKRFFMITGANQGGKSTCLRSLGQAQLMMQCGIFVGAVSFQAPIRYGIFTHFKKEEDTAMTSGKLDEELVRMNEIADHLIPGSLMLFNESFAATNEREGSEICRQITQALIDNGIDVFSVTHFYTYAAAFLDTPGVQYLRAQRLQNGERTFRVIPGKPLKTVFGADLYKKIFGREAV